MGESSLTALKLRMKSIKSLSKITKAMELIASSKLPSAIQKMEESESYFSEIYKSMLDITHSPLYDNHPYTKKRDINKTCVVLISGNRGFAGGYHSNLWRNLRGVIKGKNVCFFPIGKKAFEFVKKNEFEIISDNQKAFNSSESITIKDCKKIAVFLSEQYKKHNLDELIIYYTHYASILHQTPSSIEVLPIKRRDKDKNKIKKESETRPAQILYEPSVDSVYDFLVPYFISGLLYGALTQSVASEIASRKMAMDEANKNSAKLIEQLKLRFNRLRQEEITQELSEIIGAAKSNER